MKKKQKQPIIYIGKVDSKSSGLFIGEGAKVQPVLSGVVSELEKEEVIKIGVTSQLPQRTVELARGEWLTSLVEAFETPHARKVEQKLLAMTEGYRIIKGAEVGDPVDAEGNRPIRLSGPSEYIMGRRYKEQCAVNIEAQGAHEDAAEIRGM